MKLDLIDHKTKGQSGLTKIIFSSKLYKEATIYFSKLLSNLGGIDLADKSFPHFFIFSRKNMVFQTVTVQRNYFRSSHGSHGREFKN